MPMIFDNNKLIVLNKYFSKKKILMLFLIYQLKDMATITKKFKNKKKIQKNIWPTIIPTSGISCRRNFFNKF